MKKLILVFVMLLGSFTYSQLCDGPCPTVFEFACGPTAAEIAAEELRILTNERIQLLENKSSSTASVTSEWISEDGHVITIGTPPKTILASEYGHRNFGKSETFDLLIDVVGKAVLRLDYIKTLATGDVKITHVITPGGFDEFFMSAGSNNTGNAVGYTQDGSRNQFSDNEYIVEKLEDADLTDLYTKISNIVLQVQSEYDALNNPPLTLREVRINHILGLATGNVIIFNDLSYQGYDRFTIHYEGAKTNEYGFFIDQERIASNEGGHNVALDLLDPVEDFYSQISESIINVQAKYDARIIKRDNFVEEINNESTTEIVITVVKDVDGSGDDTLSFTKDGVTHLVNLDYSLADQSQEDINDLISQFPTYINNLFGN